LSDEEILELKTILESKDFWTTDEVKDLVKDKFDIDYCLNSIRKLLIKIGMNYLDIVKLTLIWSCYYIFLPNDSPF